MGSQTTLRWEKVEGAERYRVTLLDEGRAVGEAEVSPEELSYELNPIPWTDSELLTITLGARVAGEWVESRYLFERPLIPILSGGNFNEDGSIPSRAILEWTPIDNATSYQVSLICSSAEGVVNLNYRAFTPRIAIEDPLPEGAMCLLSLSARFGEERVGSASEVYLLTESRRVEREPDVCDPLSSLPWDQVAVEDEGRWVVDGQLSGRGRVDGSCGGEGPERIYHFVAPESGQWRFSTAHLETDADTVLYVRQDCSETGSELACNDDDRSIGQQRGSVVTLTLNRGDEAFIFVDSTESTSRQDAGRFRLTATVDTEGVTPPSDPALIGATCQQAPEITITPTAGEVEVVESWQIPIQGLSLFTGSCGGAGPEWVGDFTATRSGSWRFTSRGPSEVALYLRSACTRPESERASRCSSPDERVVSVTTTLQQGDQITVFADTMEPNHSGVYTLEARWLGR